MKNLMKFIKILIMQLLTLQAYYIHTQDLNIYTYV